MSWIGSIQRSESSNSIASNGVGLDDVEVHLGREPEIHTQLFGAVVPP